MRSGPGARKREGGPYERVRVGRSAIHGAHAGCVPEWFINRRSNVDHSRESKREKRALLRFSVCCCAESLYSCLLGEEIDLIGFTHQSCSLGALRACLRWKERAASRGRQR